MQKSFDYGATESSRQGSVCLAMAPPAHPDLMLLAGTEVHPTTAVIEHDS